MNYYDDGTDLDGFTYVFRAQGMSRSGRKLKPKVFNDGTVSLVGHAEGAEAPLHSNRFRSESPKTEINSSAEDCVSPIAEDVTDRLNAGENFTVGNKTQRKKRNTSKPSGGGIFKAAAVMVLKDEGRLMTTGEIARVALQRGYISCSGKTPEATMASALYTDIKRRLGETVFIRPKEGLFGLKEWKEWHHLDEDSGAGLEGEGTDKTNGTNMTNGTNGGNNLNKHRKWNNNDNDNIKYNNDTAQWVQDPAETVDSRCFAQPQVPRHGANYRDGLIDLLSAAERVNNASHLSGKRKSLESSVEVARDKRNENHQSTVRRRHRRKVLITSHYDRSVVQNGVMNKINTLGDNTGLMTGSVGEKGSIAGARQEDSDGRQEQDNCVQSPQTRDLLEVEQRQGAIVRLNVTKQLQEIHKCIKECPDRNQRNRAEEAILQLKHALVLDGMYNNGKTFYTRQEEDHVMNEAILNNFAAS
jgi:hypothetical protein